MVCYTQMTCFDGTLYTNDMFWWYSIYKWHVLMVLYIHLTCFDGVLYTNDMFWWCAVYKWHVLMVCYIQMTCFDGVVYTNDMFRWCAIYNWHVLMCAIHKWHVLMVCYIQLTCSDGMQHNWRVSHLRRLSAAKNTKKLTTVTDLEGSHYVVPNPSDQHNSKPVYSRLYSILNATPQDR